MKKRWGAQIRYARKLLQLGSFDTKEEAAAAHDRALRQHGYKQQGNNSAKPNFKSMEAAEEAAAAAADNYAAEGNHSRALSGFYGVTRSQRVETSGSQIFLLTENHSMLAVFIQRKRQPLRTTKLHERALVHPPLENSTTAVSTKQNLPLPKQRKNMLRSEKPSVCLHSRPVLNQGCLVSTSLKGGDGKLAVL
jgi:hypothetical protein